MVAIADSENLSSRLKWALTLSSTLATLATYVVALSVGSMSVSSDATGSFEPPDITFDTTEPLDVVIEARHVPPGTQPTLVLFSLEAADQVLTLPALSGTDALSTTAIPVTFPAGFTRGYVRATW